MENKKIDLKIDVSGIDTVKTLIDLLHRDIDLLPERVQEGLKKLADCDECEIGHDAFQLRYSDAAFTCEPAISEHIESYNEVLRRVIILEHPLKQENGSLITHHVYPESFNVYADGVRVGGW